MIDLAPAIRAAALALHNQYCPAGRDCRESEDGILGQWINRATVAVEAVAEQLIGAGAEAERLRILGDEDGDREGILDRFKVGVMPADEAVGRPTPIVYIHCGRECGMDGASTVLVTARDFDGNQNGLTVAELAYQALNHESEDHN